MRKIVVPQDIEIKLDVPKPDDKPLIISFYQFLSQTVLTDQKFGKDMKSLMSAVSLKTTFKNAKPGDEVQVDNEEWELLNEIVKEPSQGYNPILAMELVPFMLVITEAVKD